MHSHECGHIQYTHHQGSLRAPPPPTSVAATFPPVPEPVSHCGAATVWECTCTELLSQGGSSIVLENFIFIFQRDNHSSALCLCVGFFCRVCVFLVTFSPLAASLCVSASHCLPSDVIAPVQNRRRLGIWWCGACKWSLCQGCLF